jgi:hypothetical protein
MCINPTPPYPEGYGCQKAKPTEGAEKAATRLLAAPSVITFPPARFPLIRLTSSAVIWPMAVLLLTEDYRLKTID